MFHPAILASLVCSALMFLVAALVAGPGLTVLSGWDPGRADRRQLIRERRALLAESGAKLVLGCQRLSLPAGFFVEGTELVCRACRFRYAVEDEVWDYIGACAPMPSLLFPALSRPATSSLTGRVAVC